jgi:hypothetical protein
MTRAELHAFVLDYAGKNWPGSHPDDYDPDDAQLIDLCLAAMSAAFDKIKATPCPQHRAGPGQECWDYMMGQGPVPDPLYCRNRIKRALGLLP